ncbi:MAG: DUF3800 domain-containing protein [Anaerolinea sp.]|nr:DUF3800 domain-containing protein [Anaerolinea sp.]
MDLQTTRPAYRLYIDEVGTSDIPSESKSSASDDNHRYLSLTGVIFSLEHIVEMVHPQLEAIKIRFFSSHPDEPVVLHRREMVRKMHPFSCLRDPAIETKFNAQWLERLEQWNYQVITVTIDKYELVSRYKDRTYHPYHYALHVLLERYVMYLERINTKGDVMAEARGRKEDMKLKETFSQLWSHGTDYISRDRFRKVLTSREIKLKDKSKNITGLQIADSLAHPAWRYHLSVQHNQVQKAPFGKSIANLLNESKFLRDPTTGKIEGWGLKWLP